MGIRGDQTRAYFAIVKLRTIQSLVIGSQIRWEIENLHDTMPGKSNALQSEPQWAGLNVHANVLAICHTHCLYSLWVCVVSFSRQWTLKAWQCLMDFSVISGLCEYGYSYFMEHCKLHLLLFITSSSWGLGLLNKSLVAISNATSGSCFNSFFLIELKEYLLYGNFTYTNNSFSSFMIKFIGIGERDGKIDTYSNFTLEKSSKLWH